MNTRTILTIIIIFALIFFTNNIFATNNTQQGNSTIQNVMENAGNGIRNVVNGTGNIVGGAISGISQEMSNMGNDITKGMQNMEENTGNMNGLSNTNSNYNAERTATAGNDTTAPTSTFFGMDSTTWTWIIMGIVGIAIIALVWFYSKQRTDKYDSKNEDNF